MSDIGALLVAAALLWVPGLAVGYAAKVRGLAWVALAPALSLATLGLGALLAPLVGLTWSWWAVLAATALACVIAALVGYFFPLVAAPRQLPRWNRRQWAWVAGFGAAATGVAAGSVLAGMGWHLGTMWQRRDMVLHGNLVELIRQTGDASPFHMDLAHFPAVGRSYYPAAVHALAALVPGGAGSFASLNAVTLVAETAVWTVGLVHLSRVIFPARASFAALAAGLAVVFQATPSALQDMVPYGVGVALLPGLLGWSVQVARLVKQRVGGVVGRAIVLAVALVGVGLTHPIALFSYAALAAPVALYIVATLTVRGWRRGWRVATLACDATLVGLAAVAAIGVLAVPEVRSVLTFTPWEKSVNGLVALGGGLADATSLFQMAPNLLTAAALVVGVVVLLRRRSHRWLAGSLVILDLLYAAAAAGFTPLEPVTGLWYGDRARLGLLVTIVGVPLACLGLDWARQVLGIGVRAPDGTPRRGRPVRVAVAVVTALAVAQAGTLMALRPHQFKTKGFEVASTPDKPRFYGPEELAMIRRLPGELEPGQLVLGDPNNGSALVYALAGIEPVFGHVTGKWNQDRRYLLEHFPEVLTDPAVCEALDRLDVGYLYTDPVVYFDTTDFASLTQGLDPAAGGFELVDQGGGAAVWRITGCGGA
ncbi:MAG: hypothetical protein LBR19_01330 [Bifidobacteriaceae bacterium]|jgi:hypothetical protein|nr:hypothetical protein [Bifidobacteriaceae bacterium]